MADDLIHVLTRFHREVVMPDVQRVVETVIGSTVGALRDEMLTHFDSVETRFERLESEYQALSAAVLRLEERMGALVARVAHVETLLENEGSDRPRLRAEVEELKRGVEQLQRRIAKLESAL